MSRVKTIKAKKYNKYIEYYWLRKSLYIKSKELDFGYGQLPKKFTEGICNELYNMKEATGKENEDIDSIDKDGKKIEIKSTQGDGKNASINKDAKYDFLFWINFDYDTDIIRIRKYTKLDVDRVIANLSKKEKEKSRPTINLNKISNEIFDEQYKFKKISN